SNLRALAGRLGLSERVHFLGRVPEDTKWQGLHAADAYASTTMHEGFGLVYVEAMASGLPVVTYDRGGQGDFLVDRGTGRVVRAGDTDAMTDALVALATDRDAAKRLGAGNRARADQYRIETCAAAYERIFERVSGSRPAEGSGPVRPSPAGIVA